ncbi:MAG: hypothetical protein KA247_07155 [Bacteroidetes bacterium]|nr:hypothetical protein [Bacteroidota bacterium]
MKKSSLIILLLSFTIILTAQQKIVPKPQTVKHVEKNAETPSGKFIGSLFNDFSYVLQEPQPSNTAKGISGPNAFGIRRASVGYLHSFNKNVTAKIEYDANANTLLQGFVDVRNIVTQVDLKVGAVQTLSSEVVEKIWDYRSMEASVLDRKAYAHEFDRGITITGRTDAHGTMYARFAVYNGNGTAAENNKVKKLAFAFGTWLDKSSVLEAYVDFENLPAGKNILMGKVFYGMVSSTMALGAEAFYRLEKKMNLTNGKTVNPVGVSVFTWLEMTRSLRGILRFDGVENDLAETKVGHRELYVNAGIDYMPVPDVHIIPNLIYTKNLKKGTTPEIADRIEARLTTAVTIK